MAKKQNEYYTSVSPLRLTELQDSEIRAAAKDACVTVNTLVRETLTKKGIISEGPEPKARKGYGKKDVDST